MMKPWSVYLRKAVGKMGWLAGPWNTGVLTAFQGMGSSVRPSHSCPSTSSPFSFYSSWLVGFSSPVLFVSSFIKNQANPGGHFQDPLSRIWSVNSTPYLVPPVVWFLQPPPRGAGPACSPVLSHFSRGLLWPHEGQEKEDFRRQR